MKDILDPSFKYKPSFDTDIRETFERIRREREEQIDQETGCTTAEMENASGE